MTYSGNSRLFHEYMMEWIETFKFGAVRGITYKKYIRSQKVLAEIAPDLRIDEIDRRSYQTIINEYAASHEKQTVKDFNNHLKAVILDAVDEGLIKTDPTRKVIIKGKAPSNAKKPKYLSQHELKALLSALDLTGDACWDHFIYLLAKTGLRFSEALAITPGSFSFDNHRLRIRNAWDYKSPIGDFEETKNYSSKRTISIDNHTNKLFAKICKKLPEDKPIFVDGRVHNSTVNKHLNRLCKKVGISMISLHGLRHTHASLLLYAGVSLASLARRLGHASTTTTQRNYLHIIQELESLDNEKIIKHLSLLDR